MPVTPVCTPSPNQGEHGYVTIVDGQGYPIGSIATSDGAPYGTISGESTFLYNGGGPLDITGIPSMQSFDRIRSIMGKFQNGCTITTTVAGDVAIGCAAGAMKSIMPGQALKLSVGGVAEYVYVAQYPTYTPNSTATSIPLQQPLVQAGNTSATWDAFSGAATLLGAMLPTGLPPSILGAIDGGSTGQVRFLQTANTDTLAVANILAVMNVGYNGVSAERMRSPNVFKPFNAQAVTISSANTPTSIWTPATGKKFRLMGYWFSTTNAAGLLFHDLVATGGTGLLNIPSPIAVAAGEIKSPGLGNGYLSAVANNQLWIDATAATTLTGFVWGCEE